MEENMVGDIDSEFLADVIAGLGAAQKSLPCKYFYDARGSELFEQITQTPEYYPSRTEHVLLRRIAPDVADRLGADPHIIEYGAGALVKIRILLEAITGPVSYIPIDVSAGFLARAARDLASAYPNARVQPVAGGFLDLQLMLPPYSGDGQSMAFFPGSTLGNFSDAQIGEFLAIVRGHVGEAGKLLLGVDINQNPATLLPAYNDAAGITAAFNLNLLERLSRDLGADIDPDGFEHDAVWNAPAQRIEMYLVSKREQTASVGGEVFRFTAGERIHTENSRKFDLTSLAALAADAGWTIEEAWRSPGDMFANVLLA